MDSKEYFIDILKTGVMVACDKYKFKCPSFVAALACTISNFGSSDLSLGNNIFNYPAYGWGKKIISKRSLTIYENRSKCNERAPLYRAYDSFSDSCEDFIDYLVNSKMNDSGRPIYPGVKDIKSYRELSDYLVRHDFYKTFIGISNNNIVYIEGIIATLEKYKLYELDSLIKEDDTEMSRRNKNKKVNIEINKSVEEENKDLDSVLDELLSEDEEENKIINEIEVEDNNDKLFDMNDDTLFRVRLSWDNPESQIFASPILKDAEEESRKHTGYKVYNPEGNIVFDYWANTYDLNKMVKDDGTTELILPATGKAVLLKNVPVYPKPYSNKPSKYANGIYYFYDYTIQNRRVKITENANIANIIKDPSMIYGYIDMQKR